MKNVSSILIHTDGSCLGNPGPGGWGAVVQHDGHRKELSGGENPSTNNRMEMKGMVEALRWVRTQKWSTTQVTLVSDSSLLINTLNKGWKRKANRDLWAELDDARKGFEITWQWVKGHNGHPLNERCDQLANAAAVKAAKMPLAKPAGEAGTLF